MRVTRGAVIAVAGVLAVAGLAACSSSKASSGGTTGGKPAVTVLNIGMPNGSQTNNSNPFLGSSAGASLGYRFMIYEPLEMTNQVQPAAPGKPWLATAAVWSNNYQQLVITVRDGVKWTDGQALTGDDVAYTFQLMKDKPALNGNGIAFGDITAAGQTVTLTFPSSQYVNQTKILSQFIVPKHIWSTMADPTTDTVQKPIGTGPYTLTSFNAQTIVLDEVKSGYWQKLPAVKQLRYTSYTDNDAQTTALANGAAEWSFVFIPNPKAVYQSKDQAHNLLWFPPTISAHGLWLNTTKKPFDDASLRVAMSMVINRHDIVQQGEAGYFYPEITNITGIPTPAGASFVDPQYASKNYTIDVAGAKALLTSKGYTYAGNTLKDPSGKAVTITLADPSGWSDYQTDLVIIKDNLAQIGITAKINKENQDAWFKDVDTGNFDAVLHWTNGGATPYDMYENIMDGALYKPVGAAGVGGNYGRFQSPDATAALKQYATASDDATRTAAMSTLEGIMVNQMPMIPLMAANAGGEFVSTHWVGWPSDANPYAPAQPTDLNALDIVLHLTPATS
jgi:peptide/nickel transport system substrate-binding protein